MISTNYWFYYASKDVLIILIISFIMLLKVLIEVLVTKEIPELLMGWNYFVYWWFFLLFI